LKNPSHTVTEHVGQSTPNAESVLSVNGWFSGAEEHRTASSVLAAGAGLPYRRRSDRVALPVLLARGAAQRQVRGGSRLWLLASRKMMLSHTISGRFPPPPPDVLLLRPDLVRSRTRRGVSGGGLERRHDLLGLQPSLGLWAWERPGLWRVPRPDVALNSTRSELGRSPADRNHDLFAARTRYGEKAAYPVLSASSCSAFSDSVLLRILLKAGLFIASARRPTT
jgi:hypothetical protein